MKPCPMQEAPPSAWRHAPCLKVRPMPEFSPCAWKLAPCLKGPGMPLAWGHAQWLKSVTPNDWSHAQWMKSLPKSLPVKEVTPKVTPSDRSHSLCHSQWGNSLSGSHSPWGKSVPKSLPVTEVTGKITPSAGSHSLSHTQWQKSLLKSLPVTEVTPDVTHSDCSDSNASDWCHSHSQWLKSKSHSVSAVTPSDCSRTPSEWSSLPVPEVFTASAWSWHSQCLKELQGKDRERGSYRIPSSLFRLCAASTEPPVPEATYHACAWMHSQCLKALPVPAMHRHLWGCTPCMRASLCLLEFTVHDGEPLVERHMCSPCLNGTGDPGAWSRAACLKKLPVPEDKAHARRRSPDSRSQVLPEVLPMPDWAPLTWVCPMSDGEPSAWWPSQCLKNTEAPLAWSRALCM